jgi:hypothetical protein
VEIEREKLEMSINTGDLILILDEIIESMCSYKNRQRSRERMKCSPLCKLWLSCKKLNDIIDEYHKEVYIEATNQTPKEEG